MTTPRLDESSLATLVGLVAAVARDELMSRFSSGRDLQVREKTSAFDIVTDADEAAENALTQGLRRLWPQATVVGEEASGRDPGLLQRLASDEWVCVVDPLDGTKNFASGLPLFGVMVAVLQRGEVVGAVIHDPVAHATSVAMRAGGAWAWSAGGARSPLRVAAPQALKQMHGVVSTNFVPEPLRTQVNARLSALAGTCWLRCAAHEYRLAASGHIDLLFYNKLMPWDHAAGWLLHREAGGHSAHFDGSPYLPSHTSGGLLCTPDERSWHLAREALLG